MNKTVIFILLLVIAFAKNTQESKVGGYEVVEPSQINDAVEYNTIVEVVNFAKTAY